MPDDTREIEDDAKLPAELQTSFGAGLPMALQIFFNESLFNRCKMIANYLAKAQGFAPSHLIGKPEACFAIVSRSLTWKLDPYAVAQATYQTPGGQVGYYGSLCQAIIENSGRLEGGVKYEYFGDWTKIQHHFKMARSDKGKEFPVSAWKPEDENGVGVKVIAQIRDEAEPRTLDFYLAQAFPRNSTLWATDPMTQIRYTAVRRFGTSTVPTLLLGIPFDREDWADQLIDVTPKPRRSDFAAETQTDPAAGSTFFFTLGTGETVEFDGHSSAVDAYRTYLDEAADDERALAAAWENGATLIYDLREAGHNNLADELNAHYGELSAQAGQPAKSEQNPERAAVADPAGKPPEAHAHEPADDGAGTASEINARQSAPAAARSGGPVRQETRANPVSHGEAGGSPAPSPAADPAGHPQEERSDFWAGASYAVKVDRDPRKNEMSLLYWIETAQTVDELDKLRADNGRLISQLGLANPVYRSEITAAFAKHRAEITNG